MNMSVNIPIKKVSYVLLLIIIVLAVFSLTTSALIMGIIDVEFFGDETIIGFFYLDGEGNLPTWFSTMLLALNAVMLFMIAFRTRALGQPRFSFWFLLACIFVGLSLDEFIKLHEYLIMPVRTILKPSGLLFFGWFIPVIFLLIFMGIFYLPFLFRLPAEIRNLFILAAIVYIGGAIGFEALGGLRVTLVDPEAWRDVTRDLLFNLIMTAEEVFEMLGALIFFYALSKYTSEYQSSGTYPEKAK